jgi:hypothetical protein
LFIVAGNYFDFVGKIGGWGGGGHFADLNFLLDLRTFRKCSHLRICDLRTIHFAIFDLRICGPIFCGLKTSANPQFFPLTNISFKLL